MWINKKSLISETSTTTFLLILTLCSLISSSLGQINFRDPANTRPNPNQISLQTQRFDKNEQIVASQETFALDLYLTSLNAVRQDVPRYNFIMAPFSVWSLLVLITEGASGTTYSELIKLLGVPDDLTYIQNSFHQIQNYLRVNSSLTEIITAQIFAFDRKLLVEPNFSTKLRTEYDSDIVITDFSRKRTALDDIEAQLKRKTNGRIPPVLQENDLINAQMIMISALIFNSQWKYPFNSSATKLEPFYDDAGNEVGKVNMMSQKGAFPYTGMAQLSSHLLELPYANGELSMILMLPIKGVRIGELVQKLKNVSLEQMFAALRKAELEFEDDEVEVHIPRFNTASELSLQGSLEELGLRDLFQPDFANLRKITPSGTFLSSLIHRVEIKVNEEGTYASAITAGVFSNKATPPRFYANRPFFYLIVEKQTNTILFMGQYEDPQIEG